MSGRRNIVLGGFMGSGKTVVGKLVAEKLSRSFVDMDEVLACRLGMSVSDIFRRLGETLFRREEAALCHELAAEEGLVIATGGGALVNAANRDVLSHTGTLICLTAPAEVLWQRMAVVVDRPLLEMPDRRARLEQLLSDRQPAYRQIPHQLNTADMTAEEAADRVVAIAVNAEKVQERVLGVHHPLGFYPIFITKGGMDATGLYLRSRELTGPASIITDEIVGALLADRVWKGLSSYDLSPSLFVFPAGEEHKTLGTVENLVTRMVEYGLGRDAAVATLGGGVVGDTGGFTAAIYMRGVPLIQLPTTLLAMVDSSVGGKVAVDLPAGKNLVGAFKQPELVLVDLDVLESLPVEEKRAGLAEMVKAAIIGDPELFAMFESGTYNLVEAVEKALRVKIEVVEADPYEKGRRATLNLGHTFAHAYEKLSNFSLRHGEAVAMGMVLAAELAAKRGLASENLAARIERCLRQLRIPCDPPALSPEDVVAAMKTDKKKHSGQMRFILPADIGDVRTIAGIREEELLAVLAPYSGAIPA